MKSHKLLIVAFIMLLAGMLISGLTLFYLVQNKDNISFRLQSFEDKISHLNPINGKNATDEQVKKAVEDYCEWHNNCSGLQGDVGPIGPQGPIGAQGIMGSMGLQGPQGLTGEQGPKGDTGETGPQGEPGENGPESERRCVVVDQTTRRIEWRNVGYDVWQIEYYLSVGQKCPQEVSE